MCVSVAKSQVVWEGLEINILKCLNFATVLVKCEIVAFNNFR